MHKKKTAAIWFLLVMLPVLVIAGSAIDYTQNTSPATTDELLGIDNPTGSWAINRYPISDILDLIGDGTVAMTTPALGTIASGDGTALTGISFMLWQADRSYTEDITGTVHGGSLYLCTSTHTAAAANEPGVGVSWTDVWEVYSTSISNITEIATRPITSLTSGNYKLFYSADGGAPLELALGASGTYLRSAGADQAPTASAIATGDLPVEIDPDKIGTDATANDKIEAGNLNIQSMDIDVVDSIFWPASGMSADGTQCADPAEVTINSGPIQYTAICADNDASSLYGHVVMPDGFGGSGADAFTVTFELEYLQTAADTGALNSDITAMCRSAGDAVNSTWGTEVAIDDAAVTGSNAVDHTTSAAVTPNGTCAAGDTLFWRWQMDAAGTTTAVATLHILGVKMEFTKVLGDN